MVRRIFLAVALLGAFPGALACGNAKPPQAAKNTADGGASSDAAAPKPLMTSPLPSNLPAMAAMPPPGVTGSKKAKTKEDATLAACGNTVPAHGKDPAAVVKSVGDSCKMKPAGALWRGQLSDKEPHQDQKAKVEAKCYRMYFAGDEGVKELVAVVRDSAGDIVTESGGPSAPQNGSMCFTAADEITVSVAVGSGKGAWAAQLWSE